MPEILLGDTMKTRKIEYADGIPGLAREDTQKVGQYEIKTQTKMTVWNTEAKRYLTYEEIVAFLNP